jgi:Tol biopolymer transport system component
MKNQRLLVRKWIQLLRVGSTCRCVVLMIAVLELAIQVNADSRLVTGDANGNLHDFDTWVLDLSSDGNLVLFSSGPPVAGSTPGITRKGLYLRNLRQGTLEFVGVPAGGENNNDPTDAVEASMSDNGRYIAWATPQELSLPRLIYWRDHAAGETRLVTIGADADSRRPILSADGRYVAFLSIARNLPVPPLERPASGRAAVYLYDSETKVTSVASLSHDGKGLDKGVGTGPGAYFEFDFSADGRYVVFSTDSTNVHPSRVNAASQAYFWLYRRNLENGQVDIVCRNADGEVPRGNFTSPVVDATASRVLFTGGFVGLGGGPLMIDDYSFVFGSDLYLKDLNTEEVWWVTQTTNKTTPDAAFGAGAFALSGDGKVVAFGSSGVKFLPEPTDPPGSSDSFDIFRVDIGPSGAVTNSLITRPLFGTNNVGYFSGPLLPHDGRYVAFNSRNHFPLIGMGELSSIYEQGFAVGEVPGSVTPSLPPRLGIRLGSGSLTLQWPEVPGYRLTYKSDLSQPTWVDSAIQPTLEVGTNSVVESAVSGSRYYLLQRP